MTKLGRAVKKAIRRWCEEQEYTVKEIHSAIPRAYVAARLAVNRLVVAVPPCDAPELSSGSDLGSVAMLQFDPRLRVGDWCSVAYVTTEVGSGWAAIPAVVVED